MLKPRPLPPLHKNQMFVPVKSFGFYDISNNKSLTPNFFRNHEVARKKLKPRITGAFVRAGFETPDKNDEEGDCVKEFTPRSQASMTSLIHIRGRASRTDVTDSLSLHDVKRTTPTSEHEDNETKLGTSFLTEDPTSYRSYDGRSTSFSPFLECSKYNIIGEPRFRKKRVKTNTWSLPKIIAGKGFADADPKTNSIDLRSIYGTRSKVQQVPPTDVKKEDTVVLPPLQVGRRQEEAEKNMDPSTLAEKRLVMSNNRRDSIYTKIMQDHVAFPTAYRPYFRYRQRQQRYARSLFPKDEFWENNRQPVHCSRCVHQTAATLHYCDVLGKRFCRFCSEMSDRTFSNAYENNRLLVPSPNKSPTLRMLTEEPSFVGVRKIVITKRVKDEGEGDRKGQSQSQSQNQREKT